MALQYEHIRQAKLRAELEFRDIPGIMGYGIGDGTLICYIKSASVENELPVKYKNIPLQFIVTGVITAQ